MKNKCRLVLALAVLLLGGCQEPFDPDNGNPSGPGTDSTPTPEREVDPEITEPLMARNERIYDGRHVTAYVTYYGELTPDAYVMTHINYAFAEPDMDGDVYKGFKVQGKLERFERIAALKKYNPELKICLSFANSDQGGGFSGLCKSEDNRKRFAEDCKAFLQKYGLDGIDLDWEFPGLTWGKAAFDPSCDTENYVLLAKQLRETLGADYELSYAGYCSDAVTVEGGYRYVDIAGMDPYIDYVNIMTYDLDQAPHHHSALKDSRAYKDCVRAVQAYLDRGVAPQKLVLGIPFYGRHTWGHAITYKSILQLDRYSYRRNQWDEIAQCPYVETMSGTFYCGYDNPRSIAAKGEWARKTGLLGLMYWEYDQDDANGTLRTAVWNAVMQ